MRASDLEPVSPPKIGGSLPHDEYIRALYSIAKSLKRTADETPTLRDWFAGQAIARTLSAEYYDSAAGFGARVEGQAHEIAAAEAAYRVADALLAHREKLAVGMIDQMKGEGK